MTSINNPSASINPQVVPSAGSIVSPAPAASSAPPRAMSIVDAVNAAHLASIGTPLTTIR